MSSFFVHASAIVDEGALIGEGSKIWHFCHVMGGACLGRGCILGQNVFVARGVTIGDRVKIQNNVSVYDGVVVEDDAFLGPSCVFTNVNNPRSFIERKSEYRPTRIGRGASVGANATIVCGHSLGDYAFIGAGAVVTRDVPAHALMVGNPARQLGWMCKCGERLGVDLACNVCGDRYVEGPTGLRPAQAATIDKIPMLDLDAQHAPLRSGLRAAFERVLDSSHFIMGPEVTGFEGEVARYLDVRHAIGVSSGTDALVLALMALGIGAGDEVVVPTYSFFATAGAVSRVGARPVFVDVDPERFSMSVEGVRAALTAKTKAVIPVHLFGDHGPIREICSLAADRGIPVIEDAAQALGAKIDGRSLGTLGAFGCYSFFPSKNLGALGDAGLLVTNDDKLAARARRLRTHGAEPKYFHAEIGGNFRLDALQAAFLRVKLPHLDGWTRGRQANANRYDEAFAAAGLPAETLRIPRRSPDSIINQYTVLLAERDRVRSALAVKGISTEIYYPRPLHLQECYASLGMQPGSLPTAEDLANRALSLPVYPEMSSRELEFVASAVVAAASGR